MMLSRQQRIALRIMVPLIILLALYFTLYHSYRLEPLVKFRVQGLTLNPVHRMSDGYGVAFALADDAIYIIDTTNPDSTAAYCYDYTGKRIPEFRLPSGMGYDKPFNDNCFNYLPQSKILAYNHWSGNRLDFYSLQGKYLYSKKTAGRQAELWLDADEYRDTRFYLTVANNTNRNPYQINLYTENRYGQGRLERCKAALYPDDGFGGTIKQIQLDSFNADKMGIMEMQSQGITIDLWQTGNHKTVRLGRGYFSHPKRLSDFPGQFVLGSNFFILGVWKSQLTHPMQGRIFSQKGQYIGRLKFKDDEKNELIDVNGDRLVAFDPATGVVSIYRIKVR
jgi:hypothetical protein